MNEAVAGKDQDKCLRDLYCSYYQCPAENFEERLLFQCLHSPKLCKLLWRWDQDFFHEDLQLIRHLSEMTSFTECRHEVESHRHSNPPFGLLRKRLKLRVSGQAIIKLASKLFHNHTLAKRKAA